MDLRSPGCFVVAAALSACSGNYAVRVNSPGPGGTPAASVSSGSPLANVIIIGVMVGDAIQYYQLGPDGTRTPAFGAPDPDPTRKINVQDCTQPVDPDAGNLFCR